MVYVKTLSFIYIYIYIYIHIVLFIARSFVFVFLFFFFPMYATYSRYINQKKKKDYSLFPLFILKEIVGGGGLLSSPEFCIGI